MSELQQEIVAVINAVIRPEVLDTSDDTRPLIELGLDSLDYATVLMALEDKYGLNIDEDDLENLGSLWQIVEYISKRRD
jgi:acyl carrier protein